jgi:hypothetical protein
MIRAIQEGFRHDWVAGKGETQKGECEVIELAGLFLIISNS